jgi:hypothetical protein
MNEVVVTHWPLLPQRHINLCSLTTIYHRQRTHLCICTISNALTYAFAPSATHSLMHLHHRQHTHLCKNIKCAQTHTIKSQEMVKHCIKWVYIKPCTSWSQKVPTHCFYQLAIAKVIVSHFQINTEKSLSLVFKPPFQCQSPQAGHANTGQLNSDSLAVIK